MRMPVRVRRRLDILMSLVVVILVGTTNHVERGVVYEPVDYVVTMEIFHSFEELLHEALDCPSTLSSVHHPSKIARTGRDRAHTLTFRKPHFRMVQQIRQVLNT